MQLASKKKANSLYGHIIQAWPFAGLGGPRYCHSELVFSNGQWFSSRSMNGTEFCDGLPPGDTIEDYDFLEIPISLAAEERIQRWCADEIFNLDGTKCTYDVKGIAYSFLPVPVAWQDPHKWFCSEVCTAALQIEGWLAGQTPSNISPVRLAQLLSTEIRARVEGR